jgi:hypothetical protein
LIIRRFKDTCFKLLGKDMSLHPRLDDPRVILQNCVGPSLES